MRSVRGPSRVTAGFAPCPAWLRVSRAAALALLVGLVPAGTPAAAGDGAEAATALSERLAVLTRQKNRTLSGGKRQLNLVNGRMQSTRSVRIRGLNANAASLSVRLRDGAGGSGVIDTERYTPAEDQRRSERIAVWTSGDVVVEGGRLVDSRSALVHSNGVAVGADVRIGSHVIGNALGTAFDKTAVGPSGAVGSRYLSDSVYGSFSTSENTFLDLAVGAAVSNFDSEHCVDCTGDGGQRRADQVFAGAKYSWRLEGERFSLRPYGQARVSRTGYRDSEEPDSGGARHEYRSDRATELTLGLSGESIMESPAGRLRPRAGIEVSRSYTRTSAGAVVTTGVDGEQGHTFAPTLDTRDNFAVGTGLGWSVGPRTSVDADYRLSSDVGDFEPQQSIRAKLKVRF